MLRRLWNRHLSRTRHWSLPFDHRTQPQRNPKHRQTPYLERLEDRTLPSAAADLAFIPPQHTLANLGAFLTPPSPGDPLDIARGYLLDHAGALGLGAQDLSHFLVTDRYTSAPSHTTHIYLEQTYNGLPVANAWLNISITAAGEVVNVGSTFVFGLGIASPTPPNPGLTASEALSAAAAELGLGLRQPIQVVSAANDLSQHTVLLAPEASLEPIPASLQYVVQADGVELTWRLVLRTPDGGHWYDVSVNSADGELVWQSDWVDYDSYNALRLPTESVQDGGFSVHVNPADPVAAPFAWHDTNGVAGAEFTDTRGNNVDAHLDRDGNNVADAAPPRPNGGASLDFSGFTFDPTSAPSTLQNENMAVVNLFYMNNVLHDVHYHYGFNEISGNFQVNNYGNGGLANDAVQGDAQDNANGGSTNNANMFTPADGTAPRMQMFIWTPANPDRDSDLDNGVIIHEFGHGVSNRLTGGPANPNALNALQSGGMGEGWSDWWALMFTQRATDVQNQAMPIGTYVLGQAPNGPGIRREPYSFDMTIDPLTLASFNGGFPNNEVHNSGEIWCSVLWDMNWMLINKYGFDADLYTGYNPAAPLGTPAAAGNKLALQLVMDGLKLQPANPSFIQARDAIIQADQVLTGGKNFADLWIAFARRGWGFSASTANSSSTVVTQAFDLPPTADIFEKFDTVTAPALPFKWSTQVGSGSSAWTTSTTTPLTTPNDAFLADVASTSDTRLLAPFVTYIAANNLLEFRNYYNTESGADFAKLEISMNGGAFADIVTAGGSFVTGGYNSGSGWTGDSGGYILTVVNLPAAGNGKVVQFRWRLTTDAGGAAPGWRIDDVGLIVAQAMDHGDAPISYGTLRSGNGARHGASGLLLGAVRDSEADVFPPLDGTSDDTVGSDDDDGVSLLPLIAGGTGAATVTVTGAAGRLDAWIDFDQNGVFGASERITAAGGTPVVVGANTITFSVPAGATLGTTFTRFRLSTAGGLNPTGYASNGEVEDSKVNITTSRIIFTSLRDGNSEIYLMDISGAGQTNLTNNSALDTEAAWSPDGTEIAFVSDRDGDDEIYVMKRDGSGVVQLTNNPARDRTPAWSPDGAKIAFTTDRDGQREIYVMNADGSAPTRLTNDGANDDNPAWSPNGAKIAFETNRAVNFEIFVMNADGTSPTNISNNAAFDGRPNWSPDGAKIVFNTQRDGNSEIYVMNPDGSSQTRLTNNPADDSSAAFSPDGSKIVFSTDRDGNQEIYTMKADGTSPTRLTNVAQSDADPAWGSFFISAATLVFLDGSNNLVVFDAGDKNDSLTIQSDIANNQFIITDPFNILKTTIVGATGDGTSTVFVPFAAVTGTQFLVDTLGGDDSLTVDRSLGQFGVQVVYAGGTNGVGGDKLFVQGGPIFTTLTYNATGVGGGNLVFDGIPAVFFSGLEPVTVTPVARTTAINLADGLAHSTTFSAGPGAGNNTVSIDGGLESMTFVNPTTQLNVNGDAGPDTFNFNALDAGFAAGMNVTGADTINLNTGLNLTGSLAFNAASINLNPTSTIRTSTTQTYNGAVVLGVAATTTSTGGNITFAGTVDGAFSLNVNTAGATTFGGAVGGGTALTSVTTNAGGTTLINGGGITTSGAQTYNDAVRIGANAILNSTGAGNVVFAGSVNGGFNLTINTDGTTIFSGPVGGATALASLTTDAAGATALNGGSSATTGAQLYGDAVTLGANTTFSSSAAGDITLGSTVDGASRLTVNTAGITTFDGVVGGTTPLTRLITNAGGATHINGGAVTTVAANGDQTYNDAVVLLNDAVLSGNDIRFNSTVDSAGNSFGGYGVSTPVFNFQDISGSGTFLVLDDDEVSGAIPIGFTFNYFGIDYTDLFVSSNGFLTVLPFQYNGCCSGEPLPTPGDPDGVIAGWWDNLYPPGGGSITYQTLGAPGSQVFIVEFSDIQGFSGGVSTFEFKLFEGSNVIEVHYPDAQSVGDLHSAGIEDETGTFGTQFFLDTVSMPADTAVQYTPGGVPPASLTVNTNNNGTTTFAGAVGAINGLVNLTTNADGVTAVNGGAVTTFFEQTYSDALTLGAATTLTSLLGGDITAAGTVNGGVNLTVNTGGSTFFDGPVGNVTPLTSLTTDGPGVTAINGGSVRTSRAQTYNDSVNLGADTTLTSTAAGAITFADNLNDAFNLNVNTAGVTTFGNAVGNFAPLNNLTTDAAGSTTIAAGTIETDGDQTFNDPVDLGFDTILVSSFGNIAFTSTVNGGFGLFIESSAATILGGAVGGSTPLTYLITDSTGNTAINGGLVITETDQTYGDPVTLGANATLTATAAGDVTFADTLDGGFRLTVNTAGLTTFGGVGGGTPLAGLTTDAGGTTHIRGDVTTSAFSGDQTYNDAVVLDFDTVLSGNDVTFNGTVDAGAYGLSTPAFDFQDIAASGTFLSLGDNEVSGAVPIGFTFNYFGIDYTEVFVSSNGFITVLPGQVDGCCSGGFLPEFGNPDGVIAGWWEDFNNPQGNIRYQTLGSPGSQVFIVEFDHVAHSFDGPQVTYQIKLFEGSNSIEVHYPDAASDGGFHSAGIENETGTIGTLFFLGTDSLPADTAVRYTPGVALTVNTSNNGTTTFAGPVTLSSLTTNADGTTAINGGMVTTSGSQTYQDAVTLGADTILTSTDSGDVEFDGALDGGFNLNVDTAGTSFFGGAVGNMAPLASLATDAPGTTSINGGLIRTTGAQVYDDPVTLGADTIVASIITGGIAFGSTVDGSGFATEGLWVFANSGAIDLGAVGSIVALDYLSVISKAPVILRGDIATDVDGGNGAISFNNAVAGIQLAGMVTLNSDVNFDGAGGFIDLTGSTVDAASPGAQGLTLISGDSLVVTADLGINSALAFLTIWFSGSINLAGDAVVAGPVILEAQNDIVVHGIDAGADTIDIFANQDEVGSEGFTQAGGVVQTTNGSPTAIGITVNSPVGGSGNAQLLAISAGATGRVTILVAGGDIVDGNAAAINISAGDLQTTIGGNIGLEADPLETAVATLTASTNTGGIFIANSGALNVNSAQGGGKAIISASSPLTISDSVLMSGDIVLTAGESFDPGVCADDLTVDPNASVTSLGGNISLNAGDDIVLGANAFIVTFGAVELNAGFNDLDGCGDLINNGATIFAGTDLGICVLGDLSASGYVANGTVSLRSHDGAIIDTNGPGLDIIAAKVALKANTGIGVGDALETAVGSLEAQTATGGIFLTNNAGLIIGGVNPAACVGPLAGVDVTSSGNVFLSAATNLSIAEEISTPNQATLVALAGSIIDLNGAGADVTAGKLLATASVGVGTVGDSIETAVANLEAVAGNGGVFVSNTGSLVIGGISGVVGVSATGGGIRIQTASPLTVNENVVNTGAGDVVLQAGESAGAGDNLTTALGVTIRAAVDNIQLLAGDNIALGSTITVSAGGTVTIQGDVGDLDVAGSTITVNGTTILGTALAFSGGDDSDTFDLDNLVLNMPTSINGVSGANDVATVDNVSVTGAAGYGLFAQNLDALSISAGSFSNNQGNGMDLFNVGALTMNTVNANANVGGGSGIVVNFAGAIDLTNVTANANAVNGLEVSNAASVTIDPSSFSNNGVGGLQMNFVSGVVSITDCSFNGNTRDGANLFDVPGGVILNRVSASSNHNSGLFLQRVGSVRDTAGEYSNNFNSGIYLDDIAGDVTLTGTVADNNNADGDAAGDGLTAFGPFNGFAIGGNLQIDDAFFRDRGGADDHQVKGITIFPRIGGDATFNRVTVTGNEETGVSLSGGDFTATGGTFSNNGGPGMVLSSMTAVTLNSVTASNNHSLLGTAYGVLLFSIDSLADTAGIYTSNDDGGISALEVAGNVSLTMTTALNNDADNDGFGDGFNASAIFSPNQAIGGDLIVAGGSFSATGGNSQTAGISIAQPIGGSVDFTNVTATGNNGNGVFVLDGGTTARFTGGEYSNNGSDGIAVSFLSGGVIMNGVVVNDNTGEGIALSAVGAVAFTGVTANGNDPGVNINGAPSFSDTDGTYSNNDTHGIFLTNIAGNVTLTRTAADNNNADNLGGGDGVNAALGGNLLVQGGRFRDTGGANDHQQHGIFVNTLGGSAIFQDSTGPAQPVTVTGNEAGGVVVNDGGTTASFTGGVYSGNGGNGVELSSFAGSVMMNSVTASSNRKIGGFGAGVSATDVGSFADTAGVYIGNDESGVRTVDVAGGVTLVRTTANNNDANSFGGDGFTALDSGDPGNLAIGGNLLVQGCTFSDTDGAGAAFNQRVGLAVARIAGNVTIEDAVGPAQATSATGNRINGIDIGGSFGNTATITGGAYTGNGSVGLRLDQFNSVSLDNLTASTNAAVGFIVSNLGTLNLSNLTLKGNGGGSGGNFLAITTVNFNPSSGVVADTVAVAATQLQHTRTADVQQRMAYANIAFLNIFGQAGADIFNVTGTNAATNTSVSGGADDDVFNLSSDAPAHQGNLDGIQGTLNVDGGAGVFNALTVSDFSNVAGNPAAVVTAGQITGFAPGTINYFAGGNFNGLGDAGVVLRGSNTAADSFTILGTLAGSTTRIEGLGGADTFANDFVGNDNGDLDGIAGQLTLVAGAPGPFSSIANNANPLGTRDVLYLNDRGDGGMRNYVVAPGSVTSSVTRPFAGVFFDGTMDYVRLDGTDLANIFDVSPSLTTQFTIDGNLPAPGVCTPGGGDFLRLNTAGTTGRNLHLDAPGNGDWSFTSGHQHVSFESIERFNHVDILAIANGKGSPIVKVYDAETMQFRFQVLAYPSFFQGGVRVATGDVNCDGLPDLITGSGPGRAATINVFNGAPNSQGHFPAALLTTFLAYEPQFKGGVNLAVGDVNNDGAGDIITGADSGWLPQVRVFDGQTLTSVHNQLVAPFLAYGNGFRGGVRVAVGDLSGDGFAEIVTGTGPGASGQINVFDGASYGQVNAFLPFGGGYKNGVFVAVGDVDGNGVRDIIASVDKNWLPIVNVFNGATVYGRAPELMSSFQAFSNSERTGVRLAVKTVDGGAPGAVEKVSLVLSSGSGGAAVSRKVRQSTVSGLTPNVIDRVFENFKSKGKFVFDGIYVG